jgi:hypothetical protein
MEQVLHGIITLEQLATIGNIRMFRARICNTGCVKKRLSNFCAQYGMHGRSPMFPELGECFSRCLAMFDIKTQIILDG